MKKVIKFISILMLLMCGICFFKWCHNLNEYKMIKPEENITKIELVYIPDYRIIATEEFHRIEMLDTIAEDQWDIFLDEFDDLKSSKKGFPPIDYIDGYAIKITYDEDDFMLISSRSGYYFYSNYKNQYLQYSLDIDEFDAFFQKWQNKNG